MQKPIVSVIVLTLNSERFIRRCLESIQSQTYKNYEVIIVDAGSLDNTKKTVESYGTRFRWLELPNSDMGAARNYGMSRSTGEYICFLDSDDFYLPLMLETQIKFLIEHVNVDVVFSSAWHFRSKDPSRLGRKHISRQPAELSDYLKGMNHNLGTMCMRRGLYEKGFIFGEGESGRYGEEWRLQLSMALQGVSMAFQPKQLMVAELRPDSHTTWSRQWKMKAMMIEQIQGVSKSLSDEQARCFDLKNILDNLRMKLIIALILDGQRDMALRLVVSISQFKLRNISRLVVLLSFCVPVTLLKKALSTIWLKIQDRSFEWHNRSILSE